MPSAKKIKPVPQKIIGGRKTRNVGISSPNKLISRSSEGNVYEVTVTLRGGNRVKTMKMAEKIFHADLTHRGKNTFLNPSKQFIVMKKLLKLNRKKKLGLRIVPSIRLRKREGQEPSILLTRIPNIKAFDGLTSSQREEFYNDFLRQKKILERNGFKSYSENFFAQLDHKTGKVVAILGDFGKIGVLESK